MIAAKGIGGESQLWLQFTVQTLETKRDLCGSRRTGVDTADLAMLPTSKPQPGAIHAQAPFGSHDTCSLFAANAGNFELPKCPGSPDLEPGTRSPG